MDKSICSRAELLGHLHLSAASSGHDSNILGWPNTFHAVKSCRSQKHQTGLIFRCAFAAKEVY